jgi:hypothetical protein
MNELKEKTLTLKEEIIGRLVKQDLTGQVIFIRDEISNFSGGCIDHEVGGLCTKVLITRHEGREIDLVDDFEEEVGTFELDYFGIELLLTLLE